MSLTTEQRAEKIASKLYEELYRITNLNDSVRDMVYTLTIAKLELSGQIVTAQGIRALRTMSLEIPPHK